MRVVLPAPFSPTKATVLPGGILREILVNWTVGSLWMAEKVMTMRPK
jgi:hypothetical protein